LQNYEKKLRPKPFNLTDIYLRSEKSAILAEMSEKCCTFAPLMDNKVKHRILFVCHGNMMMDFTKRPGDVADPWYTGNFEATWRDVLEGCQGLLDQLVK
jgi:hypothetical protein